MLEREFRSSWWIVMLAIIANIVVMFSVFGFVAWVIVMLLRHFGVI